MQQISDMMGVSENASGIFKNSNCVVPINDIKGVEAMGYAKGEKIVRCKLAAVLRLIDLYGWAQGVNSQITARLNQDEEHFLVNPFGVLFHEVTASSLIKVDMQASVIEQVAVSALKCGLLPVSQESVVIGEVSLHQYIGDVNDIEEKEKIARTLGPINKFCDNCDSSNPEKMHPASFAVDGIESWWQSPPLSRGMKYNEVNLTIDLGQEFHVAYVFIQMANSPRPGLWILEKSADYGKTYVPWQYFSDSKADCENLFGADSLNPITRDDSVICTTEYSAIVPLEGGEIPISLLNGRPSANHYFNSSILQEWTRATNVRFRFLRTKNLLGHLMTLARQDPTVTRRYFYSIKDISIGGRCMCNGHADSCDVQDSTTNILLCRCQHNTYGAKCEKCRPGFQQKAWKISKSSKPFECEPCNCFGHSDDCLYNAEIDQQRLSMDIHGKYDGGGVCQNCRDNTEGINCNQCKSTFYRPFSKYWNETDVCQPCDCHFFYSTGNCAEGTGKCECRKEFTPPNCDKCSFGYYDYPNCKLCECYLNGTEHVQCEPDNGQCHCKYNYGGKFCKECADQYYNFPDCQPCECNTLGSVSMTCDHVNGNCTCKSNYGGRQCDQCKNGYYSYPSCSFCKCDILGTQPEICNKENGQCLCKEGYAGERCDQCKQGYYGYPECKPCNCSAIGSASAFCDAIGNCRCLDNFGGRTCEKCSVGYYKFPDCLSCNCDSHGSVGVGCDYEGHCQCRYNFDGNQCNKCREGFYNFPTCEECNCNPAGVAAAFGGCGSVPVGELCQCKERVEGRICDRCKPLYWNLHLSNAEGCKECQCHGPGVLGGNAVCNPESGQCVCKPSVVARRCTECIDGTYNMEENSLFGCIDCNCDIGGSLSPVCDKVTGQCPCQSRVIGKQCHEPLKAHYFPTLYQYEYEAEDGYTTSYGPVRYAYNEEHFPNYSWKGYAVFSKIQSEISQDVHIFKPSLYRMIVRYVNVNPEAVTGFIKITPDNPNDNEQTFKVNFKSSIQPTFVTVAGDTGNAFVINPGRWTVSIHSNQNLLVDNFVLLPEDFYLASILNQKVEKPCIIGQNKLCRQYGYPNASWFDQSWGSGGYTIYGSNVNALGEYYENSDHLRELGLTSRIPLLNVNQPEIFYNVTVRKPGRYILVINYVTPLDNPETYTVKVETTTQNSKSYGEIILYNCPYTMVCRQVVVDKQSGVGIHFIDGNSITVGLQSVKAKVGIHSVIAIPVEEWSLDFVNPKPVCVRKDNKCVQSTYTDPPESKKIQFEQETEGMAKRKIYKFSNDSAYIQLNPMDDMIDLHGKVVSPGMYVFIVNYFQPDFSQFNLDAILQNGEFYEAHLPIPHCPSVSGCRSLLTEDNGNTRFSLTENFMISLKMPKPKNVYLDYLLVVPADLYSTRILEEDTFDRTGEFISTCGNNHFNIDTSQEGFCRDSVFSITAAHNNGALPCQCDFDGSLSFECNKFGGQCNCKPNVIGRQCEACKTGYYGFPGCRPCNCPSTAVCETNTGRCICPTHVTGKFCDQCVPYTYGYDPISGCLECNCHPLGVDQDLQCNLLDGNCRCKKNIVGRQCNTCADGYFAYPYCEICECDVRGTTDQICDQTSAECLCKKYVTGPGCNLCKEGSYHLQRGNEEGCTECFCFGKTSRCISSNLVQTTVFIMDDWKLVSINTTKTFEVHPINTTTANIDKYTTISADFTFENVRDKVIYFSAPIQYLGSKLTSYGGFLNYTIFYSIGLDGRAIFSGDVIIEGGGLYLVYISYEQPASSQNFFASLQLVESNFVLPSGLPAKREHIMTVLHNLRGLYLRATYWTASIITKISNVLLDDAISLQYYNQDGHFKFALSVEQCQCPPGYDGLSCEYCAAGYYRIMSGPHGGYCVPCQCNEHADECDVNTGICISCKHNTRGDHCESCAIGFHGNAFQGTPMDCLICACPLPVSSNNFATGCEVTADGEKISCQCNDGYFGARCHSCAPGYYGLPETLGDYCKPCQCSGNINPHETGSCDTVTGECLRCLNNTSGEACALCMPGYYGDAILAKDCQPCVCDSIGTQRCSSYTGLCECKPNVIGEKCDRCKLEHFGFQSGYGCIPCQCGFASLSTQCDDFTGQCMCKPGVTGRRCDQCAAGFWNYTDKGCDSCGCKTEYSVGFGCNAETGHCECLPGVMGEKCDQCPYRWVFVPEVGCHSCDTCVDGLLNDTDHMQLLIDPYLNDFYSVDSGYFTNQRLAHINYTLQQLIPRVQQLDVNSTDLSPVMLKSEFLEQLADNLNRKAIHATTRSKDIGFEADAVNTQSLRVLEGINDAVSQANSAIGNVEFLSQSLVSGEGPKIDAAVIEAEEVLNQIKDYDLVKSESDASKVLTKANELIINLREFKKPADILFKEFNESKNSLRKFNNNLGDAYNQTQLSFNKTEETNKWMAKFKKDALIKKLDNIDVHTKEIYKNLNDSRVLLANATRYLTNAQNAHAKIANEPHSLERENMRLNNTLEQNFKELSIVEDLVPQVQDHAANLSIVAEEFDNLFTESRNISTNAVRAATAYKNIVDAVDNADAAVELGENAAQDAATLLLEVREDTGSSHLTSANLLSEADSAHQDVVADIQPRLADALAEYRPVKVLHNDNVQKLNNIEKFLKQPHTQVIDDRLIEASKIVTEADNLAQSTLSRATEHFVEVSKEKDASKTLPNNLDDTLRDISKADKQIKAVNKLLPRVERDLQELPSKQAKVFEIHEQLTNKIKILKQQIALARDVANRIRVGVKFYPNSTLELQNPPNLDDLSTSAHISGYFKTKEPNGLLFYLGNGVGTNLRRTSSDDFMALEVENGYLILTMDVGNGPQRIVNNKFVSNDTWYQFIIDRTAHNAKLTVREQIGSDVHLHVVTDELVGPNTIFNLDKNQSKLFVGGYPPQFPIQEQIQQNSFDGEIEDFVIGEIPISLWNFVEGNENNHGATRRDQLLDLTPSTGFRFNGYGYIIIDARSYSLRSRSDIQLSFKTFAPTGLIFLVFGSKGKTFLSLELRDGRIVYQYNLGGNTKMWVTSKVYNDGNWHVIEASRAGSKSRFIVDKEDIPDSFGDISGNALESFETFFVGGYPQDHSISDVTNVDFDGCIDNVAIMSNPLDLSRHIKAYGVVPGCPEKFARMVSFGGDREGYISNDHFSSGDVFQMNLRFRTKSKEGLILFGSDKFRNEGVSLSLVGGRLILISQKVQLESDDSTYNDNEWHVVTITHNSQTLRLDVDDHDVKVTGSPPPLMRIMYGDIYFGGLPSDVSVNSAMLATRKYFSGCIVDASQNGDIINFASFTNKRGEYLGKCVLDEPIGSETNVHTVPTLLPIKEINYVTTLPSEEKTEEPYIAGIPQRGDGGRESRPMRTTEVAAVQFITESVATTTLQTTFEPPAIPPVQTTTKLPPTKPSCALPMVPAVDVMTPTRAYKYSREKHSRSEYNMTRGKIRKQFDFTFEFKTTANDGIIFYVTNPTDVQFVALYLQEGHIMYSFNGGSGPAVLRSDNVYNDGNWHHVNISRAGSEGRLIVDDQVVIEGRTPKNTVNIQLYPPYYVGGIIPGRFAQVYANINTTAYFDGCISNFYMNGYVMDDPLNVEVIQCLENVEPGVFFGIQGGYVKLEERFKVGLEIDVKMEIKPRNVSGLLLSVHGKKDYLVLEMVDGIIRLTVENGKGAISTSFQPSKPHYFCDGQWHNIQAVKSKNVVTLSVDNTFTNPGVGDFRSQSTDTGGALFLGGHRLIHKTRGLSTRSSFVGCIKDVQINNYLIHLDQKMAEGHVTFISVCSCRNALKYFLEKRKVQNCSFVIISNATLDLIWVEYTYYFGKQMNVSSETAQELTVGIFDYLEFNYKFSNQFSECIEIFELLGSFNYKFHYKKINYTQIKNNITEPLVTEQVDILACHPDIGSKLLKNVVRLYPTLRSDYVLIYDPLKLHFTKDIFILTFVGTLWICFFVLLLVLAACLHLSTKQYSLLHEKYQSWSWVDITLWANAAACQQGLSHTPNGFASRLIFFLGYVTSYLLYTGFAAGITSLLLQQVMNKVITVNEIQYMNVKLVMIKNYEQVTIPSKNTSIIVSTIDELFTYINQDDIIGVAPRAFIIQYLTRKLNYNMTKYTTSKLGSSQYLRSFLMRRDDIYKDVNKKLLRLQSSGLLNRMLKDGLTISSVDERSLSEHSSAGIEHVGSAITILEVGALSSTVFLVFELIFALYSGKL
ncbi:hypothetical protein FQA39_LY09045 [Lamprigera yunnana]|nr:hypothetical protein FQA39_LY09045 [Lamprigera yunnana]